MQKKPLSIMRNMRKQQPSRNVFQEAIFCWQIFLLTNFDTDTKLYSCHSFFRKGII